MNTDLISKNDEKSFKNSNKINEKLNTVHDEVLISTSSFFHDMLSIKYNEATHDCQTNVDISLKIKMNENM